MHLRSKLESTYIGARVMSSLTFRAASSILSPVGSLGAFGGEKTTTTTTTTTTHKPVQSVRPDEDNEEGISASCIASLCG